MPKLEELLKAKGYADADLQALAPMLQDPTFRRALGVLEDTLTESEKSRETLQADWQAKLDTEWQPRVTTLEQELVARRKENAQLKEVVSIAKDYGLLSEEEKAKFDAKPQAAPQSFDAKQHKLVTYDDVAVFAEKEGDAIALAHDLSAEYGRLNPGKSLIDYVGTTPASEGKRGMRALRAEALASRKNLEQYVAEKFDFAGSRQRAIEEQQKKHDDAIREETRAVIAQEYGNPALRKPLASRQPFIPAKPKDSGQPWERGTENELRSSRLERAARNLVQ